MGLKNHKTILLVEDEPVTAKLETKLLEKNGFHVIPADSGETAVESVRNNPGIDLIFMDIDLGSGIDGTEAAEIILKNNDIPLIFLSSHTEPEIVEKTENITSYGYLVKNTSETVLIASIKMAFRLFDAKKKEQEKEEILRESEKRFVELSIQSRIMIWEVDADGLLVYVSEGSEIVLGYKPDEIIGRMHFYDIHPDEGCEEFKKAAFDVFAKKNPFLGLENPAVRKNGSRVMLSTNGIPVFNDDGSFKGYRGSDTDITNLKKAYLQ